jgi:predicted methyltransferase
MRWELTWRLFGLVLVLSLWAVPVSYSQDTYQLEGDRLSVLLKWRPGNVVAEIGAKKGQLALVAAAHVGPQGKVFATELDPEALAHLEELSAEHKNMIAVQAGEAETNLPPSCCDSIFMRLVYHHLTRPAQIDASLFRSLKPGGLLGVIDEEPSNGSVLPEGVPQNRAGHGIPQKILIDELTAAGFKVETIAHDWPHDEYHQIYCVVFRKKP